MRNAAVVIAFLEKLWNEEAQALDSSLRPRLDSLRAQLESYPNPRFDRLAARRFLASNTLREGDISARMRWDQANQELAKSISQKVTIDVSFAARLNYVLTAPFLPMSFDSTSKLVSPLRSCALYTADGEYLPPEYVPSQVELMNQRLKRCHEDVLQDAFVAYAGLVCIHPFENGNGRTSRLLADAILLAHGWLPVCFPSPVQSHVAQRIGGTSRTLAGAYATFLRGLIYSYDSLLYFERAHQNA